MTAKQIICVKWGRGYGPEYVNRLYAMARRHVTGPLRFVCLTDLRDGIRPEIECHELPELGVPHPQRTHGKWRKVVLWGSELAGLAGPTLYIDLDSVIVGSLDDYFSHGAPDDVILARNWAKPFARLGQTSVFRYPVGRYPHILENFRADPQGIADRYRYEQHYITASVPGGVKLWPEGWTRHFRLHCLPPFPLRYVMPARLPRGARIVTFPGGPNPHDVVQGRWSDASPLHETPWQHLRAAFGGPHEGGSTWQHLRRYVRPCPWLAEHWRE